MNNPIHNYEDLLKEKERLENQLKEQKEQIKKDFTALKDEMKPVANMFQEVGKFTKRDKSNTLLNAGVDITTGFLLNKFVLRKAGFITNLVVPFLIRNYSSNVLDEKGPTLLQRLSLFFNKRRNGSPIDTRISNSNGSYRFNEQAADGRIRKTPAAATSSIQTGGDTPITQESRPS